MPRHRKHKHNRPDKRKQNQVQADPYKATNEPPAAEAASAKEAPAAARAEARAGAAAAALRAEARAGAAAAALRAEARAEAAAAAIAEARAGAAAAARAEARAGAAAAAAAARAEARAGAAAAAAAARAEARAGAAAAAAAARAEARSGAAAAARAEARAAAAAALRAQARARAAATAAAAAAEATGPQGAHGISAGTQASGAAWGASRPWRPEEGARPKIRPVFRPEAERPRPDPGPGPQRERYFPVEVLLPPVGPEIVNRRACLLEQFLLYKFKMKQPILKADMLKLITPRLEDRFLEILRKASERIELVFAVRVQEVDSVLQTYDLVGELKLPNNGRVRPGRGLPKSGLLMNVLGMIFLKGNCAKEDEIWSLLSTMQVFPGKKHYMYGEPRKLLTQDLVRLQYLEYTPVPDTQPLQYEFRWGPKSYAETSKLRVLKFLAKANNTVPIAFPAQYQEALQEEQERVRAEGAVAAGLQAPGPPVDLLKKILETLTV